MPTAPVTQAPPDLSGKSLDLTPSTAPVAGSLATPAPSNKAVVVTSGAARQVTADHVAKLTSLTTPPATTTPTTPASGGGTPAPYVPNIGPQGPVPQSVIDNAKANPPVTSPTGKDVFGNDVPGYQPPPSTSPTTNADGTPNYDDAVKGITDPAIAAQYKSSLQSLDKEISDANATLDAAKSTYANDPAADAMVASIKAQYDQQIQLMKDKNTQFLGKVGSSVAAFGGLGPMSQSFLNDEQQRADARVSDIQGKEQDAMNKARIAYQTQDYKALNDAMTAYDKANKDKLTALNDLLTATDKSVKESQAQAKISSAADKQAVALDISKSNSLATGIADSIAKSGITDQGQIDQYVQSMADEYGITNPDILKSAVEKARQASMKSLAGTANTLSTIQKRETPKVPAGGKGSTKGSGTDGTYSYTQSDVGTYSGFLDTGGTDPSGTRYNGRGSDGYVDPGAYTYALNDWVKNGGTPGGFAKKFPVKTNVNPASYEQLPEAIRPKAATPITH